MRSHVGGDPMKGHVARGSKNPVISRRLDLVSGFNGTDSGLIRHLQSFAELHHVLFASAPCCHACPCASSRMSYARSASSSEVRLGFFFTMRRFFFVLVSSETATLDMPQHQQALSYGEEMR